MAKFIGRKAEINSSIVQDMQKKIAALSYPKGYSCCPVLIHANGVTQDLIDSDYFVAIIDFTEFLSS